MSENPIVELKNIAKTYGDHDVVAVTALQGIDLSIDEGEFVAIAGPSGSGKTTVLNLMGGLDSPTSGSVRVGGIDLASLNSNRLAEFRLRNMSFIFQSYNLIPVLTVEENAEFVLLLQGVAEKERRERVREELLSLGLTEDLFKRLPSKLSGGQQQRVAVARATVARPKIVFADEPTANLDTKTGRVLIENMLEMNRKKGITFIFSTHEQMVMDYARRLIRLTDGRIEDDARRP